MPRTVKPEAHAARRNQIIEAAQQLVLTKGYERMTLQDILQIAQISSGAFYHYFESKPAVLEAFIERMRSETEKPLLAIINDPQLSALKKLQGFFDTFDRLRLAHKSDVIALARVWYTDDNAIVRQKVDQAACEQRAPLLNAIVHQGLREGAFTVAFPDQAGEVIMSLVQGMGNAHAKLLLTPDHELDEQRRAEAVVAVYAAYMDAIERVLGLPPQSLRRIDTEAVKVWTSVKD